MTAKEFRNWKFNEGFGRTRTLKAEKIKKADNNYKKLLGGAPWANFDEAAPWENVSPIAKKSRRHRR